MIPGRPRALALIVPKPSSLLLILLFSSALIVFGDAPATLLSIRYTGTDFEGRAAFQLEWNAVSNANYLVQKTGSLATGTPWETVDIVMPSGATGQTEIKGRSIPENSVEFYRLLLPQPESAKLSSATAASCALDMEFPGETQDSAFAEYQSRRRVSCAKVR